MAKPPFKKFVFVVLLAALLFFSAWWRWLWLDAFIWGADEGIYLMVGRLVAAGFRPYSEVFFSQMPLFLEVVRLPLQWSGSVSAVRGVILCFALLEIGGVAFIGRDWDGNLAGLAAGIFLSLAPSFFYYSRTVIADVPAVALSVWASWAALRFSRTGYRRWLVISGVLLALSFLLKLLPIYVVFWIALLIIQRRWTATVAWSERTRLAGQDALYFGLSIVLPLLGMLLWYDALSPSILEMRLAMRRVSDSHISLIPEFGQNNIPLILLTGYGLIGRYRQPLFWTLLAWSGLAMATLLVQAPLYPQHLQLLPPILAISAGLGLAGLFRSLQQICPGEPFKLWLWRGLGVILLVVYVASLGQIGNTLTAFKVITTTPFNEDKRILAEYVQHFTAPGDCLVTDDLNLAFWVGRLTPPSLAEISSGRLRGGYLTYDELVSATQAYGCQVIAPVSGRLKNSRSDFIEWGKGHFLGTWQYDNSSVVLVGQPLTSPRPSASLQIDFENQVELVGFDLAQATDNVLYVSLYWRARQNFKDDYSVFVHLQDKDDAQSVLVYGDHKPYDGLVPTSRWPIRQVVKETICLDLPPGLAKGEYQLKVGLYLPNTLERLPVVNDLSGENAVIIPVFLNQ